MWEVREPSDAAAPPSPEAEADVDADADAGGDVGAPPSEGDAPRSSLGKFHFLERIGRGGMGEVYLALISGPTGFNKLVVVKTLREDFAAFEAIRAMFLDEGRLAARLNHPNVVQTNEVGVEENKHYLVMEYLEGQPLDRLIKHARASGGGVPAGFWLRIALDTLGGLHYAHELCDYDGTPLNVVHRDLSPHNVFVTYEGVVKVLDFGIAKAATQSAQTQAGTIKGKPAYMPPEQLLGTDVDRRADVFVFGIVLWEMFAGTRLFTGTLAECLKRIMGGPLPRVSSVVPGFDPGLDAVVARALERDPDARFQTAQEMREALVAACPSAGAIAPQEAVGELMRSVFRERREQRRLTVQRYVSEHLRNPGAARGIGSLARVSRHPSSPSLASTAGVAATIPTSTMAAGARASQAPWPEATGATMSVGAAELLPTSVTPGQGAYAFGPAPAAGFGPPPLAPPVGPSPPQRPTNQGRAVLWAGLLFGAIGLGSVGMAAWLLTSHRGARREVSAATVAASPSAAAPLDAAAPSEPQTAPPKANSAGANDPLAPGAAREPGSPAADADNAAAPLLSAKPRGKGYEGAAPSSAATSAAASNLPPAAPSAASRAASSSGAAPRAAPSSGTALRAAPPSGTAPRAAPSSGAAPRPSQDPARRPGRTFRTDLD